jgi:hypothetical protein
MVDWDEFLRALAEAAFGEKGEADPAKYAAHAAARAGVKRQQWDVANQTIDARIYAIKYWGWKAYRDRYIESWFLRRNDIATIVSGLEDIADSEGWSDKKLARMGFSVYLYSTKRSIDVNYAKMVEALNKPSQIQNVFQTLAKPQYDYLNQYAKQQIKDVELDKMHPAYKRPGTQPFGDSVMSFRAFVDYTESV